MFSLFDRRQHTTILATTKNFHIFSTHSVGFACRLCLCFMYFICKSRNLLSFRFYIWWFGGFLCSICFSYYVYVGLECVYLMYFNNFNMFYFFKTFKAANRNILWLVCFSFAFLKYFYFFFRSGLILFKTQTLKYECF